MTDVRFVEKGKEQRNERRRVEKEEMITEAKCPFISDEKFEEWRSLHISFKPLRTYKKIKWKRNAYDDDPLI